MKKPYFDLEQRLMIRLGTIKGDSLSLHLSFKKLFREVGRTRGYIGLIKLKQRLRRALNI